MSDWRQEAPPPGHSPGPPADSPFWQRLGGRDDGARAPPAHGPSLIGSQGSGACWGCRPVPAPSPEGTTGPGPEAAGFSPRSLCVPAAGARPAPSVHWGWGWPAAPWSQCWRVVCPRIWPGAPRAGRAVSSEGPGPQAALVSPGQCPSCRVTLSHPINAHSSGMFPARRAPPSSLLLTRGH